MLNYLKTVLSTVIAGHSNCLLPCLLVCATLLSACEDAADRAKSHHAQGLGLLERGAPEKAALEFRNALRLDEAFVPARFELAKLLEQSGDLNGATANLNAIVERDPAHVQARIRLAHAMLIAGAPEDAMSHAEVAVRVAPDVPDALVARALVAYRLGDVRIAVGDAEAALDLQPGHPDAGMLLAIERYDAAQPVQAIAMLDRFIALHPQSSTLHMARLRFLSEHGDNAQVGAQLNHMVGLFPNHVALRKSLVRWHIGNGDFAAADAELITLQQQQPDDAEPVLARLQLRLTTEGVDAARAWLVTEIDDAAQPDVLRLELSKLDLLANDLVSAEATLQDLIMNSDLPEASTQARLLLAKLQGSENAFEAMEANLTTLLESDPGNAEALALRAAGHLKRGVLDSALADIRNALAEQPDDAQYLALAGEIYSQNGSPNLAEDAFRKALRFDPGDGSAHATLAVFLDQQGRAPEAKKYLSEGLQHDSANPAIRMHLAALALRESDSASAIRHFEQMYADHPQSLLAANNLASVLADHALNQPDQLRRAERIARVLADSAHPAFQDTYGWIQVLTGNAAGGLEPLQSAAQALPENPWVQYHLGMAYLKLDQSARAQDHLNKALKFGADTTSFHPQDDIRRIVADLPR